MKKKILKYKDFTLEYACLNETDNQGNEAVFCFHGFGRILEDFELFVHSFPSELPMYSFHIFQHGKSQIKESRLWKEPILKDEAQELFLFLLESFGISKAHLLAYSIGGRMALTMTELLPQKIASLILISPDGIKNSPVYLMASKTKLGIALFKWVMEKPNFFFKTASILNKVGLVSKSQYRVMKLNLETAELRKLVGETWYVFSRMNPDIQLIQENIKKFEIRTLLIFGDYDKVIPVKIGRKFENQLGLKVLHTVPQGHALMNSKVAEKLKQLITLQGR